MGYNPFGKKVNKLGLNITDIYHIVRTNTYLYK